jgi:DNA-binding GntR family transcriptional regulator
MAKAAETAYEVIRQGVLSGEFARGQRLREEELAARVGVSRTPVREALRRLNAEGLVDFTPNRGAKVTAWSERELADLYEARAMLEGFGARLAAGRITADEIAELHAIAEEMAEVAEGGPEAADRLTELNGRFHRAIVKASRNTQLDTLVRGVMDVPLIYRTFQRYSPDRLRASQSHHRELVEAFRAGDGEWAEAVMRAHILAARTTVLQSLRRDTDGPRPDGHNVKLDTNGA